MFPELLIGYLTLKWTCRFSSVLNMCEGGYQNDKSADAKPNRLMYTGKIPGKENTQMAVIMLLLRSCFLQTL